MRFDGVPYANQFDIDLLSEQIEFELESEGWSASGNCPICIDQARKEAASE